MSKSKSKSLWDAKIVRQALIDAVAKLNPRMMMRNPVMFVVEIGSVLTTVLLVRDALAHKPGFGFNLQITLMAVVHGVLCQLCRSNGRRARQSAGGNVAQEPSRRRSRIVYCRGGHEDVAGSKLRVGDIVVVSAGELIPGDGDVIEGVASVDESAITGSRRR